MDISKLGGRIIKSTVVFCALLACVLLARTLLPTGENKAKLSQILLAEPVFAQQATAFPADEAGISAYVNAGQTIDLDRVKGALTGIQAEGDNYIIGIMELSGLPEEEFPHMYVSTDGWILAYYSKFAPAAKIMHWNKYGGGTIKTSTLESGILAVCSGIGINYATLEDNIRYYDFKYPHATKLTIAVDTTEELQDTFNFSVPLDITLYEGSWSHYSNGVLTELRVDDQRIEKISTNSPLLISSGFLQEAYLTPDKVHTIWIDRHVYGPSPNGLAGIAVVFIYR